MKIPIIWLKDYINFDCNTDIIINTLVNLGFDLEGIQGTGDDCVLDLEITPNRPDCLSLLGIARELTCKLGGRLRIPEQYRSSYKLPRTFYVHNRQNVMNVKILDKGLCKRYIGISMCDVKVGSSPDWLKRRLELVGINTVNNVVDVTNYILYEIGQPMHAFDQDKIIGFEVLIRRAKDKEEITLLNEDKIQLDENALVIADEKKPIALAGIMGGVDTAVSKHTKRIFLEVAQFDSNCIRKTARKCAISTESSYRFERNVDSTAALNSAMRAVWLLMDKARPAGTSLPGCRMVSGYFDSGIKVKKPPYILLKMDKLKSYLGRDITERQVSSMLSGLGFFVVCPSHGMLRVQPPAFRQDVLLDVDVIEEVLRHIGHENLPAFMPKVQVTGKPNWDTVLWFKKRLKDFLVSCGSQEVMTYTLISERMLQDTGKNVLATLKVNRALSKEQEYLRSDITSSLLTVVSKNNRVGVEGLNIFEIARVFCQDKSGKYALEKDELCIMNWGKGSFDWAVPQHKHTFHDLKGITDAMLKHFAITADEFLEENPLFSACCVYKIRNKLLGYVGVLKKSVAKAFDVPGEVYVASFQIEKLLKQILASSSIRYAPVPRFPAVMRDTAIVVDTEMPFSSVMASFQKNKPRQVKSIQLRDIYKSSELGTNKKGICVRLEYREESKSLTDEQTNSLHQRLIDTVLSELRASLRK